MFCILSSSLLVSLVPIALSSKSASSRRRYHQTKIWIDKSSRADLDCAYVCPTVLYNSFTGMAEIATAFSARPVIVRHRQFAILRPSADILAQNFVDMPFKFVSTFFFDLVLYFMSGLQVSASQFFIFVLFTYITNLAMLALFRALASANRAEANATTFAGVSSSLVTVLDWKFQPDENFADPFRLLS